ncbi:hypothetical protein H4582DRAFT_2216752 [Lactarius indigo]|nr:hypothetical protein H4582DRAFT_2216752 [Lactarius indigo]
MVPLPQFPLPLPNQPPDGYGCDAFSTATAFETIIDQRDKFLGRKRCIICHGGCDDSVVLQHSYIIEEVAPDSSLLHDPRNGLLMCANHRLLFDGYYIFIRFFPDVQKYVLVYYSGRPGLQSFHGKAVALDIKDHYASSPAFFILHEMRVHVFYPFAPLDPDMLKDSPWQDWIESEAVFDKDSGSFRRNGPPSDNSVAVRPAMTDTGSTSSSKLSLPPNADVIADILAGTRVMPWWKACEEGMN